MFTEEKVEETKVEAEADTSTAKPNENQLSLSMCVNTDDVQDDLDEDLKEMQQVKLTMEKITSKMRMYNYFFHFSFWMAWFKQAESCES